MCEGWRDEIVTLASTAQNEAAFQAGLRDWQHRHESDDRFADVVFQSAAMAWMAGNLFVRDVEVAQREVKLADVSVGADGAFLAMDFEAAIGLFRARNVVPPEAFFEALEEMRARAFTATRLTSQHVREVAYDKLLEALAGEGDFDAFARAVRDAEVTLGIEPQSHGYLRTVFDTNVVSAYSAGRDVQLADEDVIEALPYRVYRAVIDARTRPTHAALDGKAWDARLTGEWRSYQGPNGFNCRCMVVSDDEHPGEAALSRSATHPDPSFAGAPRLEI